MTEWIQRNDKDDAEESEERGSNAMSSEQRCWWKGYSNAHSNHNNNEMNQRFKLLWFDASSILIIIKIHLKLYKNFFILSFIHSNEQLKNFY